MTEQELMAQFEREYCEEFRVFPFEYATIFDKDECGLYTYSPAYHAYKIWKRTKLEVRTVEIPLEYLYGADDDAINVHLEDINVKVEFV